MLRKIALKPTFSIAPPRTATTGGVGTVMFTVIGLLCMGAALWFFLFARRRREDEQEQNKTTL